MTAENSRRSSSVYSTRTISFDDGSTAESFPFEDDPEFLELPEIEKDIMKQNYRNTQEKKRLASVASSAMT